MARARNIKPAFFQNDDLAELEPIERLFFIGLWTVCDYRGGLEYRPKRMKAQILPYDDVDVERIAINLERLRFIRRYSVQGIDYIKIINFSKHQNPHKNERQAGSDIPDIDKGGPQPTDSIDDSKKPDFIGTNPDYDGTDPADSLLLIPDSLNPLTDSPTPHKSPSGLASPTEIEKLANVYIETGERLRFIKTINKNASSSLHMLALSDALERVSNLNGNQPMMAGDAIGYCLAAIKNANESIQ